MACFVAPASTALITSVVGKKISKKYHFDWLNTMLWGGVVMLIVEHIAHGEILAYPPFFTAGIHEMLPEVLRVGVPMTLLIIVIWGILVAVDMYENKKATCATA